MKDKCIVFYGEIRVPELCYELYNRNFNLEDYDIYISGWDRDLKDINTLKKNTKAKGVSIINPVEYLKRYNFESTSLLDKCNFTNCSIFGQYISIDNIKNFNIEKYKEVLITRPDLYLKFSKPNKIEDNCIYDQPFVTHLPNDKKRFSLYGFFLYGSGKTLSAICENFFENILKFYDFNDSYDKILKKIQLRISYACSSPRCMWYIGVFKDKNIKIKTIKDLVCYLVRPGVEKYDINDPDIIHKWAVYKKYKRNLSLQNKHEQLTFESIDMESIGLIDMMALLDSKSKKEGNRIEICH